MKAAEQRARLAAMPEEADAALFQLKAQVRSAWSALGTAAARPLFCAAIATATPVLPHLQHPQPNDLDQLLADLDAALFQYHAEEIRVVRYTFFSALADLLKQQPGDAQVQGFLTILDRA